MTDQYSNSFAGRAQLKLKSLQRRWNSLGADDVIWAILGTNEESSSAWNSEEFFQTGRNDIALVRKTLEARGVIPHNRTALDFGCGIGRLTQAMAELFDRVVGVDIAPSMIEQAERMNRFPANCSYLVNADDDLRMFEGGSFDFIISRIVLQHLPRRLAEGYLEELLRLLSDGGVLVVQIPARRIRRRTRYFISNLVPGFFATLRRVTSRPPRIPMHVIPRRDVLAIFRAVGARVIHVGADGASGDDFESLVYYVMRRA